MNTARESAVRLLKLMMVASLVLPAALYAYASWVSYRDTHAAADDRIDRLLDVQQEQALRVFQTIDRTFAEVDEVVRGMSDEQIRVAQVSLLVASPSGTYRGCHAGIAGDCTDRPRRHATRIERFGFSQSRQ
jgi:hypothetical protein